MSLREQAVEAMAKRLWGDNYVRINRKYALAGMGNALDALLDLLDEEHGRIFDDLDAMNLPAVGIYDELVAALRGETE